jgi:hypothetical protein
MSFLFVFATILLLATSTFALASDQDWQVIVYEHANFQGKSLVYSIQPGMCQRLEPQLSKAKMNDKLSSVKVGKNVRVYLFEHKNYAGISVELIESKQSLSNVQSSFKLRDNFNDKVSSLIVVPKAKEIRLVGVWLNFGQIKPSFYPASETGGGVNYPHLVYNDAAETLSLHPVSLPECQTKATIYEHADFKGKSETFTQGRGLTDYGFFNIGKDLKGKASSLKIEIAGKCPVRTQ